MNIGTVIPGQQTIVTSVGTQQAPSEQTVAQTIPSNLSGGQDFQVILGNIFRSVLEGMARAFNQQESMLQNLSPDVEKAVRMAMKHSFLMQEALPQGIVSLIKAPKMLSEQLTQLATVLEDAAKIQQQAPQGVPREVQKLLADAEIQIRQILEQVKTTNPESKTADHVSKSNTESVKNGAVSADNENAKLQQNIKLAETPVLTNAQTKLQTKLPNELQTRLQTDSAVKTAESSWMREPGNSENPGMPNRQQLKEFSQHFNTAREAKGGYDRLPSSGRLALLAAQVLDRSQNEQIVKTFFRQLFSDTNVNKTLFSDANVSKSLFPDDNGGKTQYGRETKEQSALRQMSNQVEKSMPKVIQQAVNNCNMPQLKQAWIALRLNEALAWVKQPRLSLEKDAQIVKEIAGSIQQMVSFTSETNGKGQTILNFSLPLYFGDAHEPYPAHIHIFHQQEDESGTETAEFETWMKISLMTEHMGPVDMVFRLYKKELLDIRVLFSTAEAAEMFNNFVPEIRAGFNDAGFSLKLADIMIGA